MLNKKIVVRKTVLAHAMSLIFGSALVSVAVQLPALAQSNATGIIFGQAAPAPGTTVLLENTATGTQRTVLVDANGKFQATSMPPGTYVVKLLRQAKVEKIIEVEALVGRGVEVNFGEQSQVQQVTIAAKVNRIDVSNTNNGPVFTARELAKLPISQSVAAVIQLAPGTVKNTGGGYGEVSSFGGSGVSENAYYINGFPVANILTQIGTSELPFGAIANAQILQGGFGPEFGRATGGVVNITTKSGTNRWEFGAKLSAMPNALRSPQLNTYFPKTGNNPLTDGKLQFYNQDNRVSSHTAGVYVGGPLIKSKLFAFVALERNASQSESIAASSDKIVNPTGWSNSHNTVDRYLAKFDYNLSDDHHFELTQIHDETRNRTSLYGFDYGSFTHNDVKKGGQTSVNCCGAPNPGADDTIFKYTAYLSDDLTFTTLYGQSKTKHSQSPEGYNPAIFQTNSSVQSRVPGVTYPIVQTVRTPIQAGDVGDSQKTLRIDVEYKLGKHSLRAGLDYNKVASVVGVSAAGGGVWNYRYTDQPLTYKGFGFTETPAQGGGYGPQGFYVSRDLNNNVSHPTSTQAAQYIEDRYQVADNILLSLGLRNEQFRNNNSAGQAFIQQDRQLAPRLGASWDVNRDASFKVFGNAGRYFMQVPTNLSANTAGVNLITNQAFTYSGVDPATGAPTGLHAISPVTSVNNQWGIPQDPRGLTAINLKPLFQDEMSLGFEKAISPEYNLGVMGSYRTLRSSNDDLCDQRPIDAWGARNHIDTSHYGFPCATVNPGEANSLLLDLRGDKNLVRVDLSAADIGLAKVKRDYVALNFFLEHPLRNGWYGKVNYTLSRNQGNNEGQVDSLQGNNVAQTVGWDHKELMLNASGDLPNDRRHVIKAFGFVEINPELTVGGNFSLYSGMPRNCLGELPTSISPNLGYGSSYFFCNGLPSPRGSLGRMPWLMQLDTSLSYRPKALAGLNMKVDVFNLLNSRTVISENAVSRNNGVPSATYLQETGRLSPRAVRLTMEYNYQY